VAGEVGTRDIGDSFGVNADNLLRLAGTRTGGGDGIHFAGLGQLKAWFDACIGDLILRLKLLVRRQSVSYPEKLFIGHHPTCRVNYIGHNIT
jgi:hypothetical protein